MIIYSCMRLRVIFIIEFILLGIVFGINEYIFPEMGLGVMSTFSLGFAIISYAQKYNH